MAGGSRFGTTVTFLLKFQSAVQALVLYNCYKGALEVWPKKQVIRECGPKSR